MSNFMNKTILSINAKLQLRNWLKVIFAHERCCHKDSSGPLMLYLNPLQMLYYQRGLVSNGTAAFLTNIDNDGGELFDILDS